MDLKNKLGKIENTWSWQNITVALVMTLMALVGGFAFIGVPVANWTFCAKHFPDEKLACFLAPERYKYDGERNGS